MTGALVILAATVVAGLLLFLTHGKDEPGTETEAAGPPSEGDECCGRHAFCDKLIDERETMYFDDEELDRFAGRDPDSYTAEEVEEFREVLYSLIPADVHPWGMSLTLRDIALPLSLRDEWMMLCEEYAANN